MKEVKAFKCEHCNMVSTYKGHVVRHERDHCRKSPNRKSCLLCVLYDEDEDGPFCIDDRGNVFWGRRNENINCEFFESKFVRK